MSDYTKFKVWLETQNLTPEEYDRRIREWCEQHNY
jgi:hypothetical protein